MTEQRVLIVDDEWNMRNLIRIYLKKEGFTTFEAANGYEALSMMKAQAFDMMILDVMMPGMDGWEVCKTIRKSDSNIPILMLTARSETKDKVAGLGLGADDYLTKPFEPEELVARVLSLLRRSNLRQVTAVPQTKIHFPNIRIVPDARDIYICEKAVDFTPKEFDLMLILAQNTQRAYAREELVEQLWGFDYEGDSRVIDTHVKNIREKLSRAGLTYNPIQTVWGVGYKFHVQGGTA
ncbi:response regulator transcription factor [Paenibacillus sp. N1-5-1-14]|uniref:response regulator transcription factor n=1 Tax=Paenibacillus radicibacter TaxID=2972488 RepID=UPI002159514E|nr:response regulator transcription factor [Paenibacillus radicibacter]MCR8644347.1 response regulator transcription factor [Paenibacillus radicibacter]